MPTELVTVKKETTVVTQPGNPKTVVSQPAESVSVLETMKGKQGVPGEPGINWVGDWSQSVGYDERDAVQNKGSSYYCIDKHISSGTDEPGVGGNWDSYWDLLASEGEGVSGPESSEDNGLAVFDGTNGKTLKSGANVTAASGNLEVQSVDSASVAALNIKSSLGDGKITISYNEFTDQSRIQTNDQLSILTSGSPLLISADPTLPLGVATKQYVDNSLQPLLTRLAALET